MAYNVQDGVTRFNALSIARVAANSVFASIAEPKNVLAGVVPICMYAAV